MIKSFSIYTAMVVASLFLSGQGMADGSMPSVVKACVACHGEGGISANTDWPNLAGQNQLYLEDQMKAFRSGERGNSLMTSISRTLKDKDIQLLAAYYANKAPRIAANGRAAVVAKGENESAYCVSCHGMKGLTANSEWPRLSGQNAGYLELQLRAFRDAKRINSNMNTVLAGYTDERIKALAAYYSQLKP